MVSDASSNEAEDKKRRETIEQRNKAENLALPDEKLLKDNAGKISEPTVQLVKDGIAAVEKIKGGEAPRPSRRPSSSLKRPATRRAEELYRSAAPGDQPGGPGAARARRMARRPMGRPSRVRWSTPSSARPDGLAEH